MAALHQSAWRLRLASRGAGRPAQATSSPAWPRQWPRRPQAAEVAVADDGAPAAREQHPRGRPGGRPRGGEPRTAFVLAGGAALGAMQAGMVRALYERGIAPDLLIGTSAGALNAAFLASRPATVAPAAELAAVWPGLRRRDIVPPRPGTPINGLARRHDHLITRRPPRPPPRRWPVTYRRLRARGRGCGRRTRRGGRCTTTASITSTARSTSWSGCAAKTRCRKCGIT